MSDVLGDFATICMKVLSFVQSKAFILAGSLIFFGKVQLFKTFETDCAEVLFGDFLYFYFFFFFLFKCVLDR